MEKNKIPLENKSPSEQKNSCDGNYNAWKHTNIKTSSWMQFKGEGEFCHLKGVSKEGKPT